MMNERKSIPCQDFWGYCQDPGLDLYCGIEGVDRCVVLRHAARNEDRRPRLHLHLPKGSRKSGLAAAAVLAVSLISHFLLIKARIPGIPAKPL
jgi:hypothetical protein